MKTLTEVALPLASVTYITAVCLPPIVAVVFGLLTVIALGLGLSEVIGEIVSRRAE